MLSQRRRASIFGSFIPTGTEGRRRARMPPGNYYGNSGVTVATDHPPGSPGKVEVMTERAALGLPLFNPLDATLDPEGERARGSASRFPRLFHP